MAAGVAIVAMRMNLLAKTSDRRRQQEACFPWVSSSMAQEK